MTTYHGAPCKRCGNTKKYSSGQNCVACVKQRTNNRGPEIFARYATSEKGKRRIKRYRQDTVYKDAQFKHRLKKYGLTVEQYDQMVHSQQGKCKVCGGTEETNLAVDHCHKTGKVRGLLCRSCNLALGNLKEDVNIMRNLIVYIEKGGS